MRGMTEQAARLAELYGYRYVETPAFEHTELFARTAGESSDVVHKEMYTFEDKSGRSLTLRPEGTAPVVRAYLASQSMLPSPFKGYYLEHMWRYGRPQAGRWREFRQFGLEVIGTADPRADSEVIEVGDRFLSHVGLSDRDLLVNSIGDDVCRPPYRKLLLSYLDSERESLRDEHRDRYPENPMRVLDCRDEACRGVAEDAPKISEHLCDECRRHFDGVLGGLEEAGIAYRKDPRLVRGLDYYTRTAFEWESAALPAAQASVGGGGRYDGLAEILGGAPTPGVGFAIGLDRILFALETERGEVASAPALECFVATVGESADGWARRIAAALRDSGISTDASLERRPLKAQLRMADRVGARFAAIVGEKESAAGTVTLRRLSDGQQRESGLDEAVAWILSQQETPSAGIQEGPG